MRRGLEFPNSRSHMTLRSTAAPSVRGWRPPQIAKFEPRHATASLCKHNSFTMVNFKKGAGLPVAMLLARQRPQTLMP